MSLEGSEAGMIVEHGPIVLAVPPGWQEFGSRQPRSNQTLRKFYQPRNSDVQLCLFDRGHPVTLDSATAFSGVLEKDIHELKEEDLRPLQEVIGNLALEDEFLTEAARNLDLSGKRVLEVYGTWPKLEIRSCHYFIDADGDGETVLEVYFAAPINEYDSIEELIDACLKSILWEQKQSVDGPRSQPQSEPHEPLSL